MKKKITSKKAVIFDFDDTLAKTRYGKELGLKLASIKIYDFLRGKGTNTGSFRDLYRKIRKTTCQIENKGIYNRNIWWFFIIKELFKISPPKNFLEELTEIYWNAVKKKSELYKDAISTLVYLKNKKYILGMVTDTDGVKELKSERIKKLNLKKWFNFIVVAGEDVRQTKPDKAPFLLITRKLNLKPHQCIFVGNNIYVDVLGAKKAGMATVLVKRDNCQAKIKPDQVIKTLVELKKIVL
ncbi:MAG: HAD family hydrolase [Candidatus Pacebacteria bacterium]|nr:HAD family hydrolase [Candidatus Paceibacterota bacterium]